MKQTLYIFSDTIIKRKDNTLFFNLITGEDNDETEFRKEEYLFDKNIVIPSGDKKYMPVDNVDSIFTFGTAHFNSRLIYFLSRNLIPLYVMNSYGSLSAVISPAGLNRSGKTLIAQASAYSDYDKRLKIASEIIIASTKNTLANLYYYQKRGRNIAEQIEVIEELQLEIKFAESVEELMGLEGLIKKHYYEAWREIFVYPVGFFRRIKNPPKDFINTMISFGNALLYSSVNNKIYQGKLYPEIGFVHSAGENKLSLSYDLADIFKPIIVDRTIFKIVNKNILSEKDFFYKKGSVIMKKETKKKFVAEFEQRITTKIKLPKFSKKVSYKRIILEDIYTLRNYLHDANDVKFYVSLW